MNLQSIIITNCIGCTILLILLISSSLVRRRHTLSDKLFTFMIILNGFACIDETLTFICDGIDFPGARIVSFAGNSLLYITNMIFSLLWCIYIDLRLYKDPRRIKKYYPKIAVPSTICILLLIPNIKWQFIFSISSENIYKREAIGYLYYLVALFYLGYTIFLKYHHARRYEKKAFFPIWMFIAPFAAGTLTQLLMYGVSLGWTSIALGLVGIHMSLQNELSYIDPLTNLYNRNYLNHILSGIDNRGISIVGLMIDLDFFKSINDKYGHSVGDDALVDAAKIIKTAIPPKAVAIRFAGDEFIVIMRTKDKSEVSDIKKSIRSAVEDFNTLNQKQYNLSFSIGGSMLNGSTDEFLRKLDENMYIDKKKHHHAAQENK